METGWRYRFIALAGTAALILSSIVLANTPTAQSALTALPILDRLEPTVIASTELRDELATTLVIVLGAMWPLFKPRPRRILDVISLAQKRVFLAAALLATIGYFDWSTRLPRSTLIAVTMLLALVLPAWFVYIRQRPQSASRAILVGDDTESMETLLESTELPILGIVAPPAVQIDRQRIADGGLLVESPDKLTRLGGLSRLDEVLVEYDVDTALLGFRRPDRQEFFGAIASCHEHGVQAKVHRGHADSVLVTNAAGGDIVDTDLEPWDWQDYVVKRLFDVLFAATGLLCLSPLLAAIAVSIKIDSPGPVLYRQRRTAEFGNTFDVYKFRSMVANAEAETGAKLSEDDAGGTDPRVTAVGRVLRTTHLDEIPQLWSILVGDMSVVGPRPERPELDYDIESDVDEWRSRWFVKPGLTGLAQINDVTGHEPEEKLRYDIEYIRRQSIWFDMKIVVREIYSVGLDMLSIISPGRFENE
ncbi:sugar transferase [Halomicroarcula sp. GCM10025324]|uniref:sugar transferase n=1 Tax=Haloarcula TaxID=2237 RepID=UPI0023E87516|nr:sugar transferase [Halomicroarcula sp. ZS-22-S1]